jgi:hypothetical protein
MFTPASQTALAWAAKAETSMERSMILRRAVGQSVRLKGALSCTDKDEEDWRKQRNKYLLA